MSVVSCCGFLVFYLAGMKQALEPEKTVPEWPSSIREVTHLQRSSWMPKSTPGQ